MKKNILILLALCFTFAAYSQKDKNEKAKLDILQDVSNNACKCIDSISTYDKAKDVLSEDISKCIDKQVGIYQITMKLMNIKDLTETAEEKDGKKQINLSVNMDKNSAEYKDYYFQIERNLMANCKPLQERMAANDKLGAKSLSDNPQAMELYSKALKVTEKGKYKDAIEYYKQALALDPNFVFAWDNMGLCHRRLGNYDEALAAYNKSLTIDPTGSMPLQNIPIVYTYKGEYDKAIDAYLKLLYYDKNNPEAYFGVGQIYYEYKKDYETSLGYMCKAYNLYVQQKSPYRTDAETIIRYIYAKMKEQKKEDVFNSILKENNINVK